MGNPLKDPEAREKFVRRLLAAGGFERLIALQDAGKVGGPWLLPTLASLLNDEEKILQGPHVMELVNGIGECRMMGSQRTCDVALEVILELSHRTFEFMSANAGPMRNYTPEEREEVRRAVAES